MAKKYGVNEEKAKNGKGQFPRTKNGEYIISAGNKLVYVSGSYQLPRISKVLELNYGNETNNDIVRNEIYDDEKRGRGIGNDLERIENATGIQPFNRFERKNFASFQENKDKFRNGKSGRTSNEANRNYPNRKNRGYNFEESDEGNGVKKFFKY